MPGSVCFRACLKVEPMNAGYLPSMGIVSARYAALGVVLMALVWLPGRLSAQGLPPPGASGMGAAASTELRSSGSPVDEKRLAEPLDPAGRPEVAGTDSHAEPAEGLRVSGFRWAGTASWHLYRESLMRIAGPALGGRAEATIESAHWPLLLEGEVSAGVVDYSSPVSGRIEDSRRIGSMLHLGIAKRDSRVWVPQPGLGLTTEWTDLRGVSSIGSGSDRRVFNGYQRFNASFWLSASWDLERERDEGATRLRAALLLAGWQRSMLSQAVLGYADVTNRQHRGLLVSAERPFRLLEQKASIRLGVRTHGRSNTVNAAPGVLVYEPANQTLDIGLTVWR